MNYAIIIAGGVGKRMKTNIPKQFLSVFDKPVIAYTMECFQKCPRIDGIVVVCVEGWENYVSAIAKQFGIAKLLEITHGGTVGQESIKNGLDCVAKYSKSDNDIVLVHDAIRPFTSEAIIEDCIEVAAKHGNAVSVIPCQEVILRTKNSITSEEVIDRDTLKRTQTPQACTLGLFKQIHQQAKEMNITSSVATASLLVETGHTVYFSLGSEKNIKLTTPDDLDIFKALLIASGYNTRG